jgi:transcriptional regulator with XRE-family HTH domain
MDKSDTETQCEVKTLEDFGRQLQQLRERKHVTQTSLSARVAAIAGYRISRSRISEIENARRDRITERELRVYMLGLRCTHGHIDQMMKALRQCVATPARASNNAVTPDYLTQEKEKIGNDSITASEEKEYFKQAPRSWTCTDSLDTSQSRQLRRRRLPRHINIFGAMALVIAGFAGLNADFLLRQKGESPPPHTGTTAVLLIPSNTLLRQDDSSNLVKSVTSWDRAVAPSHDKWPSATLKSSPAPRVDDANSRHTTKPVVKHCCVEDEQPRAVNRGALPNSMQDWHSYTGPWPIEPSSDQLNFSMR